MGKREYAWYVDPQSQESADKAYRPFVALTFAIFLIGFASGISYFSRSGGAQLAAGAAPAGEKTLDKTRRERCKNAYIFGGGETEAKGHLPLDQDVYREKLSDYQQSPLSSVRERADELARRDVKDGVDRGRICNGTSVCGSLFYQDMKRKDHIVCPNRCDKDYCDSKLSILQRTIIEDAVRTAKGQVISSDGETLPRWALENPRAAVGQINSLVQPDWQMTDNALNFQLGEAFAPDIKNPGDVVKMEDSGYMGILVETRIPSATTYDQLKAIGEGLFSDTTAPPPTLFSPPGEIRGEPSLQQQRMPMELKNTEGYLPPMSSIQPRPYFLPAQHTGFGNTNIVQGHAIGPVTDTMWQQIVFVPNLTAQLTI